MTEARDMRAACTVGWMLLLACPGPARAQAVPQPDDALPAASRPDDRPPRYPTRLYLGMWTTHLKHRVVTIENNWLIGVTYRGYFGATFKNSYGRQAFTAGIQRSLVTRQRETLTASLGYRLGIVTGYDGRFMRVARDTPVLPLIQGFGNVDVRRVGVEVSYTVVVVSVTMSYRF